ALPCHAPEVRPPNSRSSSLPMESRAGLSDLDLKRFLHANQVSTSRGNAIVIMTRSSTSTSAIPQDFGQGSSMAKVAFLGLGVMGFPMAGHLVAKGGHEVTVFNRTPAKADAWAEKFGGRTAATPES